jgi:hypothetical protein
MRVAYADPPYPGCAHLYKDHPDYGGEIDYPMLLNDLKCEYDGFVLHTSSTGLRLILPLLPSDARIMAWVKPFAAFKRNVPVAYAWEPVIVRAVRKPVVTHRVVMRDWVSASITLKKGLVGAKPQSVAFWAVEVAGLLPEDDLVDIYPGTGAITSAWEQWRAAWPAAIIKVVP